MGIEIVIAFLAGIISFLSPCIIPMLVVYLSSITGFSFEELLGLKEKKNVKKHIFYSTILFVASFTLVFTLVGGLAGSLGKVLSQYFNLMSLLGGIILILFGLHLMQFLNFIPRISLFSGMKLKLEEMLPLKIFKRDDGLTSYVGVFLIGFFFALVCSHCIGPTLYPMLFLASTTASIQQGMLLMFVFSIGLGIPFILVGLFLSETIDYLNLAKKHYKIISFIMGVILVLFGLFMVTGNFMLLSGIFSKIIPWRIGFGM